MIKLQFEPKLKEISVEKQPNYVTLFSSPQSSQSAEAAFQMNGLQTRSAQHGVVAG